MRGGPASARDPTIVGRRIRLSGNETLEIVGVAAPGFAFPYRSMLGAAGIATPPGRRSVGADAARRAALA